jgi:hypothetical protein
MDNLVMPGRRDRPSCRSRRHRDQSTPTLTGAGLAICLGCRDQLEDDLIELPTWYDLCAHSLDLRRPQREERVTGSRPRGIVLRDAVVTVRSDILGVLASWCGLVASERGVTGPDVLSIRKLTTFMAIHLNWLASHPAAPDLVDELGVLVSSARQVVRPDEGVRVELGRCARSGCDELVRAETDTEEQMTYYVACDAGHVVRPEDWLLLRGRRGLGAASEPE